MNCGDRIVYAKWHEPSGARDSQLAGYTDKPICSNGIFPVEWKYRAVKIGNIHDTPELLHGTHHA